MKTMPMRDSPSLLLNPNPGSVVGPSSASGPPMSIRILIADGQEMIRAGIRVMLERMQGVEVVGEAADGDTARSLCGELSPDIVMLDELIPLLGEIELIRRLVQRRSELKVIVCSARREQQFIEQTFRAGANGFLLKD